MQSFARCTHDKKKLKGVTESVDRLTGPNGDDGVAEAEVGPLLATVTHGLMLFQSSEALLNHFAPSQLNVSSSLVDRRVRLCLSSFPPPT